MIVLPSLRANQRVMDNVLNHYLVKKGYTVDMIFRTHNYRSSVSQKQDASAYFKVPVKVLSEDLFNMLRRDTLNPCGYTVFYLQNLLAIEGSTSMLTEFFIEFCPQLSSPKHISDNLGLHIDPIVKVLPDRYEDLTVLPSFKLDNSLYYIEFHLCVISIIDYYLSGINKARGIAIMPYMKSSHGQVIENNIQELFKGISDTYEKEYGYEPIPNMSLSQFHKTTL